MSYIIDGKLTKSIPDSMYITNDWDDIKIVEAPARNKDQRSFYFTLPSNWKDKANDPACELRIIGVNTYDNNKTPDGQKELGDTIWLGFSFLFPDGNTAKESITFCQFHMGKNPNKGNKGPYLALRLLPDNKLELRRRTVVTGVQKTINHSMGEYSKNKWFDVVLNIKFSTTEGFIKGWINNNNFIDITGRTIGEDSLDKAAFLKIGQYIPDWRMREYKSLVQEFFINSFRYADKNSSFSMVDPSNVVNEEKEKLKLVLEWKIKFNEFKKEYAAKLEGLYEELKNILGEEIDLSNL